jgi:outer membrane protein OmpA-like peptidoglycan-associated protein
MRPALALCLALLGDRAVADDLPAYLRLPPRAHVVPDTVEMEDYGEAEIQVGDAGPDVKRGRHWTARLAIDGLPEGAEHEALVAPFRAAFKAGGWSIVREWVDSNPPFQTVRYQKPGTDVWAYLALFGTDDIRMDLVEVGPPTLAFSVKAPAATPETFGTEEPFPYLPPLPGSQFKSTSGEDTGPILVTFKGDEEPTLVASASTSRFYSRPKHLSNLLFVTLYHDALARAGWDIVDQSGGLHQSDAVMTVHYAKNGRDIWAYLHLGDELAVKVADVGTANLAAALKKDCHVALYGVNFDFAKASLRPDSEPVLARAAAALQADASLVEVQGHTDNVGGDDYNLKLSQARAETVKAWLSTHGVAPTRLTARGYGRSHPVAENDSPEGRARNRRVELARPDCR